MFEVSTSKHQMYFGTRSPQESGMWTLPDGAGGWVFVNRFPYYLEGANYKHNADTFDPAFYTTYLLSAKWCPFLLLARGSKRN